MNGIAPATLVGFAGDWHGNLPWANRALSFFAREGVTRIYHVGDFGLWPDRAGKRYLLELHAAAVRNDQELFIVLGNHEDYDRVAYMRTDEDGWLYLKNYPRFRFAPRGHVWLDGDTRMGALGGAGSIDRNLRTEGTSWWPGEEITEADCHALVTNVAAQDWDRLDVLLTHEAPAGLRRLGLQPRPVWITPEVEHDCWTQRVRLRDAVDQVRPLTLIHGHWHEWHNDKIEGSTPDGIDYETEVYGLTCDGMPRNCITASPVPHVGLVDVSILPV